MFCFFSLFLDMGTVTESVETSLGSCDAPSKFSRVEMFVQLLELGFGCRVDGTM